MQCALILRLFPLALCFGLLLSACGDDDEPEDMMPTVPECTNSFVRWTIEGGEETCVIGSLAVANGGGADSYNINTFLSPVSLSITGLIAPIPGTYTLGGGFTFDPPFSDANAEITIDGVDYRPTQDQFGTLTITSVADLAIAGTFSFRGVNPNDSTDVVNVIDGSFDL